MVMKVGRRRGDVDGFEGIYGKVLLIRVIRMLDV